METYFSRRIPVVVAAGLALAMLALGFLAALGVRSLVARTASASPDAPNPGHEWSQIGLPPGTWPGLNADMLDGMHAGQTGTNYIPYADASGNVGIGTTSPTYKLDVNGTERLRDRLDLTTSSAWSTLSIDGISGGQLQFSTGGNTKWNIYNPNSGADLGFNYAPTGTLALYLTSSGNVGIGTTSPNAKLQVAGGDAAITAQGNGIILRATNGSNCYRLTVDNAGTLSTALVSCP